MAQKRTSNIKEVDLKFKKDALKEKFKDKKKSQLSDADVAEYVKELMANDLGLEE